jgi:hypothetical protein
MRRVVLAFLLLLPVSVSAGENLYVRAAGTDLKQTAGPGGQNLAKLDIGAKCDVIEKSGNWVKCKVEVKKKDVVGFVFAPKLGKDKPDKERFGGKTVATASEADTAQALRGLSATAEKHAERTKAKPEDIAAVKQMEQLKVPDPEIAAFLRDGKLGEFQQ